MRLLHKHLLRATAGPFLFGFVVITFVLIIEVLYRYIELFVAKGVPFVQATEVLILSLGHTFALSVPMAVLIGVLMGVGQLAADHEITAMKASGVGLLTILRPLLAGALVVALVLTAYNHFIFPHTNHRLANLLYDINRKRPMMEIRAQMFSELNERITIYVAEKDDRSGRVAGVRILEKSAQHDLRPRLTTADWGRIIPRPGQDAIQLELHDGEIHSLPDDGDPARYEVIRFARHDLVVRNVEREFQPSGRTARGDREMDLVALWAAAGRERENRRLIADNTATLTYLAARRQWDLLRPERRAELLGWRGGAAVPSAPAAREAVLRATRQECAQAAGSARVQVQVLASHRALENRFLVEFHKKFAIPFACLVFVLLGLPLAVTASRSGRGVSASVALALYLVYYLFLIGGEKISDRGRLDPALAMWSANAFLTAVGVPVLLAVARERSLLPAWRPRPPAPPPSPLSGGAVGPMEP